MKINALIFIEKMKKTSVINNAICLFSLFMIVTFCFCGYVYYENKKIIKIDLCEYENATNLVEVKINKVNKSDSDINIYASVNKENDNIGICNAYISLEDVNTGNTFIINTRYDEMFEANNNEWLDLIARCKKNMLLDGHEYNVYIILQDSNCKKYIKTEEVLKC
ncbi:MAG: hypothetical protein MSA89_07520 [Clostridium sp.]|nr:hypothetical protein [Clostridium sp.]MCI7442921.1 hypothetical protein [Clostridium sp.]